MNIRDFQFSFTAKQKKDEVFKFLLDPRNWWTGFYSETITGKSDEINDEFSFSAGNGAHYSRQRLTQLEKNKRIVWQVMESKLSFLQQPGEWSGTKICFDLEGEGNVTTVTFRHEGLVPEIECYESCTGGWTKYLQQLKAHFN